MRAEPYIPGEAKVRTKQIYHLPVVVAAFAAWYLGAIWHSQYLFRARWLNAIGLNPADVRQIVGLYLLLSVAICLLFAYGVAWLLAVCHRKGVLHGVLMSALLCGSVIAMGLYGIPRLPHDFLVIETGYTVLTMFIVGAIVGGLYDKLVMRPQDWNLRT
jgi:glucan phosphoethanolaminetransferase (alkaline phosphatase superfamily)